MASTLGGLGLGVGRHPSREESKSEGKRKASDPESVESENSGAKRAHTKSTGGSSAAPSAYRHAKRIRLSTPAEDPSSSSPPMQQQHRADHPPRPTSRASTTYTVRTGRSIPVRAIVSPRPPSVAGSNRTFHMRDPHYRQPPPVSWRPLSMVLDEEQIMPVGAQQHKLRAPWTAVAFYVGFVLFPLWWIAALSRVRPWPGREKPDWEGWVRARDERAWRRRNRYMSAVGLVVYIPLIVLAAVFGQHATVTES
ncbi:hypothetical protein EXIGLDRAFT_718245 [Exidia glandulosa HHB12029]|uniref:Uncharacterized protein n=1 Tax=Exidia glandulosa HHB12029 TaxID=1314781 RepID=A0A165HWX6_EXIGL|nr:hypothetical protein EXIGLDRAFT_718245 [Exidia glandulosa HHB12029]